MKNVICSLVEILSYVGITTYFGYKYEMILPDRFLIAALIFVWLVANYIKS